MKVNKKVTRNGPDVYSWREMVKGSVIVIGAIQCFLCILDVCYWRIIGKYILISNFLSD